MKNIRLDVRTEYDGSYGLFTETCDSIYFAKVTTKRGAEYIAKCVNEYDSLVAQIEKLKEALKKCVPCGFLEICNFCKNDVSEHAADCEYINLTK